MVSNLSFFNGCFDKGRLKSLISWSLVNCGEQFTIELVENLKDVGFEYATQAGVSISLDDLKIPPSKATLVSEAELQVTSAQIEYKRGHLTAVEKFQQLIDTWHRTSETLKQNVIQHFRATDILNPVYMMAFSGARGNVSQVRQLVGMRGLMADPQGQIIDFPIRSNFREGLTLTEYVISCYGARKGLVDTALRTANSGYLTRRLVDVSQHVIVCEVNCGTQRGIFLSDMTEGQKVLLSLQNRLLGRVLAEDIYTDLKATNEIILTNQPITSLKQNFNTKQNLSLTNNKNIVTQNVALSKAPGLSAKQYLNLPQSKLIASKNQEISLTLAEKIAKLKTKVLVRSPLTCQARSSICQLCYGWSLAHGNLVSLGEAVGILAAQSIGEPGTQLTMRTFHTGGVFSGDLMTEIRAPFNGVINFTEFLQGVLIRTPHGKIAFLTKTEGDFYVTSAKKLEQVPHSRMKAQVLNPKIIDDSTKKSFQVNKQSLLTLPSQSEERSQDHFIKKEASSLKHKFQIPSSTILFARQGEFVLEKQLIAEFSSISTQTNQRIQAKYNLNSELEGQVFFDDVFLSVEVGKDDDGEDDYENVTRIAQKLGSIWILSGKIYQTMVPTSFFPKPGDLIDSSSVINQILVISPYTGFLDKNNKKKLFRLPLGFTSQVKLQPTLFLGKGEEPVYNIPENPLSAPGVIKDRKNASASRKPLLIPNPILNKNSILRLKSFTELKKRYDNSQNAPLALSLRKMRTSGLLQNSGDLLPRKNLSLSSTLLSFSVRTVSYSQLGYFITFWNNKDLRLDLTRSFNKKVEFYSTSKKQSLHASTLSSTSSIQRELGLYLGDHLDSKQNWDFKQNWVKNKVFFSRNKTDLFFLSTSLKQELSNSEDLKRLLYLQIFPKNYKTQTGGVLFHDPLYLDNNGGQIFWIPEETYKLDLKTFVIPTHIGFTLFSLFGLSQVNLKEFLQKSSKKWINNNFPLLSKYNSQGKIINFSSKMSGWLQLKSNTNLSAYTKIGNKPLKSKSLSIKTTKSLIPNSFKKEIFSKREELVNSPLKSSFCEIYRLKTLLSNQFLGFKNRVTLPIKAILFRRNPYILVKQKYFKNYRILPSKQNYSTNFNKLQKISSFPQALSERQNFVQNPVLNLGRNAQGGSVVTISDRASKISFVQSKNLGNQIDFYKLSWFLEFKEYKFHKYFLNEEHHTSLKPKVPFINSPFSFTPKNSILTTCLRRDEVSQLDLISQIRQLDNSNNFLTQKFFRKAQLSKTEFFLSNEKSSNNDLLEIGIKSGWVYFPQNKADFLNYHKQILKPGSSFIDNIEFDQHVTRIECISIPFFLSNNYKCYFSTFQVKEKNLSLRLKLNLQKFTEEFPISNTPTELVSGFSPLGKTLLEGNRQTSSLVDDMTQPSRQNLDGKHLNFFLFKLHKCLSLNKLILERKSIKLHIFTSREIDLVKQGIPNCIQLGFYVTLACDKVYYIKNKNQRYSGFVQNKNINFNTPIAKLQAPLLIKFLLSGKTLPARIKASHKRTLSQRTTIDRLDLTNGNSARGGNNLNLKYFKNSKIDRTYSALQIEKDDLPKKSNSLYLAKSDLKLKNLRSLNNRPITQIACFDINSFIFQSILPKQLISQILPNTLKVPGFPNFFTPSFCILIRKVKQYSIFKPKYYKKLLSENNQRGIVSNPSNSIGTVTNSTWFNKQVQTKLFSSFPSADLQINSSLRFKNSKQTFVTKQLNIFEFFILLNIPKIFPFKIAKVDLNLKQLLSPLSLIRSKMRTPLVNDQEFVTLQTSQLGNIVRDYSSKKQKVVTNNLKVVIFKQRLSTNYKNNFLKYLELFYQTNHLEFIVFRNIDNSSFMVPALKNKTTQFTNTRVLLHSQNYIFTNNPLSLTDFFSPYHGEITEIKSDSLGKQSCFFLTEKDQLCFSTNEKIPSTFVGKLVRYGEQIAENLSIPDSGQIIQVDKSKVILRKAQPILFSSKGIFYVHHGDFVEKNSPLLTLFYQRLKTGDIVQGIPRIEQLFEARQAKEGEILSENLNYKLHVFFRKYTKIYIPRDAARISLEKTQQLLIDGVQKVYQSQGVTIADKHLEIIVRQMTSKVKIIEGGRSGLLRGELINLSWIEMVNNGIDSQKAEYEPVILGITKAALETESFISAASFQETTRILARAAIERKTDFLRGLKENVILGHLIPAGTGSPRFYGPGSLESRKKTKNPEFWKNIFSIMMKK